jgi:NADPH-dependent curcumin reductase CurA
MRGRMRPTSIKSYSPAFEIGKPMTAYGVAKILKSNNPALKEGDIIVGMIGWEEYSHIPGAYIPLLGIKVIEDKDIPLSYYVGVLGKTILLFRCTEHFSFCRHAW